MHTQMNAQMADETLQVIFGTILGAFCSKYLGQGLAGVCDKVRGRKIKTLRRMGAHSTHNLQLQRLALTILAFIPLHQRVVRTYLLLTMQLLLYRTQNTCLTHTTTQLVAATTSIYNAIRSDLLPTPSKSHYTYNLRDVAKVGARLRAQMEGALC